MIGGVGVYLWGLPGMALGTFVGRSLLIFGVMWVIRRESESRHVLSEAVMRYWLIGGAVAGVAIVSLLQAGAWQAEQLVMSA